MILILVLVLQAKAHPGRTDANGCHYCRTNCEQYGLQQDEYHCHNSTSTPIIIDASTIDSTVSSSSSISNSIKTTTSKKTTTSEKTSSIPTSIIEKALIASNPGDEQIEKDIYPSKANELVIYESSDYKARRLAVYLLSFVMLLVLIKFIVKR